jgi:tRNA A37 methylthiotransferase MiaB
MISVEDFNGRWLVHYFDLLLPLLTRYQDTVAMHVPVQSASNRILELMRRHYRIEDVECCLTTLKKQAPRLRISSSFMVGFPGETHTEFTLTNKFLKNMCFWYVLVFKYSERPQVESLTFENKVSEINKLLRMWHLEITQAFLVLSRMFKVGRL